MATCFKSWFFSFGVFHIDVKLTEKVKVMLDFGCAMIHEFGNK